MNVWETVKQVIAEELSIDASKIWEYEQIKKLGGDSLDLVKITIELECIFDIEFPRDLSNFVTVNDVVKYIEENANPKLINSTENSK